MDTKLRRTFLKSAAIGTAASYLAAPAIVRGRNLNEKLRIAVIGMGDELARMQRVLSSWRRIRRLVLSLPGSATATSQSWVRRLPNGESARGIVLLAITTYEVFLTISRSMP